jgi:EpsI family protein
MIRRLLVMAVMLESVALALPAVESRAPQSARQPLRDLPHTLGTWHSQGDYELDKETLAVLRADDYLSRGYESAGTAVDLFIAYYGSQSNGEAIHSPMNCLPGAGWQPLERTRLTIDVDGSRPIEANSVIVQKGLERRLVLYWYESHGRTIANEYAAKAYLVLDSIRLGRSDAALVRLTAPLHDGMAAAHARDFARQLYPTVRQHVPM